MPLHSSRLERPTDALTSHVASCKTKIHSHLYLQLHFVTSTTTHVSHKVTSMLFTGKPFKICFLIVMIRHKTKKSRIVDMHVKRLLLNHRRRQKRTASKICNIKRFCMTAILFLIPCRGAKKITRYENRPRNSNMRLNDQIHEQAHQSCVVTSNTIRE